MSPLPHAQLSLHELKRRRPRERLVQITLLLLVLLTCYAWTCGDIHLDDLDLARRTENLERFVQEDLAPYSLRDQEHSWTDVAAWAWTIAVTRGFEGALQTLAMATVAITLSAMVAFLLLWCAARTSATSTAPPLPAPPSSRRCSKLVAPRQNCNNHAGARADSPFVLD